MYKRVLLAGVLIITTALQIAAQDFAGNWQGAADVMGQKLKVVFHLTKDNGGYKAVFDSPDQQAYGIPCSNTTVAADSIFIEIKNIGVQYKGKWNKTDGITGILQQRGYSFTLNLQQLQQESVTMSKPQTPVAPFNYTVEEVTYENTIQHIHLAATLTKPRGDHKFPAVILITGSGRQDRDETIGLHKPFLVMADYLTKQGIAVLRVDDREAGKSTGNFNTATTADFATDVEAGIAYLKTRQDIDLKKIGLLGHSEGGIIAPMVAAHNKDVAFIVMLAGPVTGMKQTMDYQAVWKPLSQAGITEQDIKAYQQLYDGLIEIAVRTDSVYSLNNSIRKFYLEWKSRQSIATLTALVHGSDDEVMNSLISGFAEFRVKQNWWKFLLAYDPQDDLQKVQVPVLALNGQMDIQVDPVTNLSVINNVLTKNNNKYFKTYEVPGVNHLFQHCKLCTVNEYFQLDETFDPATLEMIGNWINTVTKQ